MSFVQPYLKGVICWGNLRQKTVIVFDKNVYATSVCNRTAVFYKKMLLISCLNVYRIINSWFGVFWDLNIFTIFISILSSFGRNTRKITSANHPSSSFHSLSLFLSFLLPYLLSVGSSKWRWIRKVESNYFILFTLYPY